MPPRLFDRQAGATLRQLLRAGLAVGEALEAEFTILELKVPVRGEPWG